MALREILMDGVAPTEAAKRHGVTRQAVQETLGKTRECVATSRVLAGAPDMMTRIRQDKSSQRWHHRQLLPTARGRHRSSALISHRNMNCSGRGDSAIYRKGRPVIATSCGMQGRCCSTLRRRSSGWRSCSHARSSANSTPRRTRIAWTWWARTGIRRSITQPTSGFPSNGKPSLPDAYRHVSTPPCEAERS